MKNSHGTHTHPFALHKQPTQRLAKLATRPHLNHMCCGHGSSGSGGAPGNASGGRLIFSLDLLLVLPPKEPKLHPDPSNAVKPESVVTLASLSPPPTQSSAANAAASGPLRGSAERATLDDIGAAGALSAAADSSLSGADPPTSAHVGVLVTAGADGASTATACGACLSAGVSGRVGASCCISCILKARGRDDDVLCKRARSINESRWDKKHGRLTTGVHRLSLIPCSAPAAQRG